ncbi:MAG: HEPN domain-containing protein [Candidatus Omnitrophota bacterium]
MITEQARNLSEYRLNKAKNLLSQAELLLTNRQYDGSINRSYYAILNAVRAVLALVGIDNRSHQGVMSYFDRYFVKTGLFEKKFSKIIHSAFDTRQDNDYEDFYIPSKTDAKEQYDNAILFVEEIECKRELFIEGKLSLPVVPRL